MHFLLLVTIGTCILSILSALAADVWLSERIAVFGTFAGLQYALNPGIAWGLQLPPVVQEVVIVVALGLVAYMAYTSGAGQTTRSMDLLGYACILGGGLANIIDRMIDGYVTDFFQVGSFPIFNVADSFVSIGVVLLLVDMLQKGTGNTKSSS